MFFYACKPLFFKRFIHIDLVDHSWSSIQRPYDILDVVWTFYGHFVDVLCWQGWSIICQTNFFTHWYFRHLCQNNAHFRLKLFFFYEKSGHYYIRHDLFLCYFCFTSFFDIRKSISIKSKSFRQISFIILFQVSKQTSIFDDHFLSFQNRNPQNNYRWKNYQ